MELGGAGWSEVKLGGAGYTQMGRERARGRGVYKKGWGAHLVRVAGQAEVEVYGNAEPHKERKK